MAEVDAAGHSWDLPLTDHKHTRQIIVRLRLGLGDAMRNGAGPEIFMEV